MAIHFLEEDRKNPVKEKTLTRKWLESVISDEGKQTGVVNLVFTSDEYLLNVNKEFLKRDYFTDVISFTYENEKKISGDVLISIDRVEDNAKETGVTVEEELRRIMVHGILHLIGFDDQGEGEKQRMTEKENHYLSRF